MLSPTQKATVLSSPILKRVAGEEALEFHDLAYSAGFRKVSELCRRHVFALKDQMLKDPHLAPEKLREIVVEIRMYQGIIDLPKKVKDLCGNRG
jgi:hypothetical protein